MEVRSLDRARKCGVDAGVAAVAPRKARGGHDAGHLCIAWSCSCVMGNIDLVEYEFMHVYFSSSALMDFED